MELTNGCETCKQLCTNQTGQIRNNLREKALILRSYINIIFCYYVAVGFIHVKVIYVAELARIRGRVEREQ